MGFGNLAWPVLPYNPGDVTVILGASIPSPVPDDGGHSTVLSCGWCEGAASRSVDRTWRTPGTGTSGSSGEDQVWIPEHRDAGTCSTLVHTTRTQNFCLGVWRQMLLSPGLGLGERRWEPSLFAALKGARSSPATVKLRSGPAMRPCGGPCRVEPHTQASVSRARGLGGSGAGRPVPGHGLGLSSGGVHIPGTAGVGCRCGRGRWQGLSGTRAWRWVRAMCRGD